MLGGGLGIGEWRFCVRRVARAARQPKTGLASPLQKVLVPENSELLVVRQAGVAVRGAPRPGLAVPDGRPAARPGAMRPRKTRKAPKRLPVAYQIAFVIRAGWRPCRCTWPGN